MRKKRGGFTLVELLVVLGIIGVLSTILIRTYVTVANISVKTQQQKHIMSEVLFLSQTLQNFADRNTIDYAAYPDGVLADNQGITDVLYLSGLDGRFSLFTSGDCVDTSVSLVDLQAVTSGSCIFVIQRNGQDMVLTSPEYVTWAKVSFKVIPFASKEQYLSSGSTLCKDIPFVACLSQPGFWVIGTAYTPYYSKEWHRDVKLSFQEFFTL